jgi:hypothetical protein|uniref:Uncharacterized protein n=1 Tax=viral metagenome TaxID=1070528 RepID=A0A6C0DYF4_9ZZZZ
MSSEINDVRKSTEFKGESFSKYKKSEVRAQLIQNMTKGKIEPACYWAAELVCAGHYMELWEIILHYVGKHIHLGNPKIVYYLEMRFQIFRNIIHEGHYITELHLRNSDKIRKLFAEVVAVLTYSNRKHSFEPIKINRVEEFDMTQMTERLKAPSMNYAEPIFQKEDPKELYIAINEFAFNISKEKRHMLNACYWVEWVIEFDLICRKRKVSCLCEKRSTYSVENKYQRDPIWLVWDTLLFYSNENDNPFLSKLMGSIMNLFCIKYTSGSSKKRRYLLYFAVALLTEPVPTDVELIARKELVYNVVEKINEVYKQIKKNEQSPNTEYLFNNLDKENNFEKSLRKMEIMDSMHFIPTNENNL